MVKYTEGENLFMTILNNKSNIVTIYEQLADQIINAYTEMAKDSSFNLTKNDVLISFDAFIQSIIIRSLLHKRNFELGEVNFIKNLVRYYDHYKNIEINKDSYPTPEDVEFLKKESRRITKEVPTFIMMSVLIDKELEIAIIKSTKTFSMVLYSTLKKIINIVLDDSEDQYANKVLNTIADFFTSNHVLFNS